MNRTHEQRLTALESEAFRNNTTRSPESTDEVALLRGAVNELSADLREHRQDTKEQFAAVNSRLDGI
ncbi:hypothetical protein, partial [Catellatospora coxensis]